MFKILFTIALLLATCQAQEEEALLNLKVATNPATPPFEFILNGVLVGFDIDFLTAVAQAASITYEYVQLDWTVVFQEVLNNQVDLAVSGITINAAREEIYDFSVPYFISTHKILAKEGTDITSAQDLLTKNVAVRNATTGEAVVEQLFGGPSPNIHEYATQDDAIQALINGEVDAYVDDNAPLEYYANNNPGFVVIADPYFASEFYGFMFPKGSELKAVFDPAITTVLENGEYAQIYMNWLGTAPDVDLLLRAGEEENPYDVFNENQEENQETELGEFSNEEENITLEWLDLL